MPGLLTPFQFAGRISNLTFFLLFVSKGEFFAISKSGERLKCYNHSTLVADCTLVSSISAAAGSTPCPSTSVGLTPNFASGGYSTSSGRCGNVKCIRNSLEVRRISSRAANCVLKSLRSGREKKYSAAWKCFCCWCERKQRNPLQAVLVTVCDFLTNQFEDLKKSYSTINSYRYALSSMLLPVDSYALGEHPIIFLCRKGFFVFVPLNQSIVL